MLLILAALVAYIGLVPKYNISQRKIANLHFEYELIPKNAVFYLFTSAGLKMYRRSKKVIANSFGERI